MTMMLTLMATVMVMLFTLHSVADVLLSSLPWQCPFMQGSHISWKAGAGRQFVRREERDEGTRETERGLNWRNTFPNNIADIECLQE